MQIIKACSNSNVKTLKIGELELSFLDKYDNINQNLASSFKIASPMEPGEVEDPKFQTLMEEEEREMLVLSDPSKFERELYAEETQEAYHIGTTPTL